VIVGTPAPNQSPVVFAPATGVAIPSFPFIGQAFAPVETSSTLGILLLPAPAATPRQVTVTSSDPAVVRVNASPVLVPAGERLVPVDLTTGAAGRATLTLETDGLQREFAVIVGSSPTPASSPVITALPAGVSVVPFAGIGRVIAPAGTPVIATLGVQLLTTPRAEQVNVTVTSSDPAVVVTGNGTIAAGESVLPVTISTFGNEGAALLTFEFDGQRLALQVVVGNPPASQLPAVTAPVIGVRVEP
jgi:hypothetical protein